MPSKIVRSASPTSASTDTSGARSPRRAGHRGLEPGGIERHRRAFARAHREPAETSPLDGRRPQRVALALAIGAIEDVGLGDLVEPLADQCLLDQILDVLDGRRRFAEARFGTGDDAIDDRLRPSRLDRDADGADRLGDGGVNPAAVEGNRFPGAFDDAQYGHAGSLSATWISQHMGTTARRSTTSCGRLRSRRWRGRW
jgi:hypothetical protein